MSHSRTGLCHERNATHDVNFDKSNSNLNIDTRMFEDNDVVRLRILFTINTCNFNLVKLALVSCFTKVRQF